MLKKRSQPPRKVEGGRRFQRKLLFTEPGEKGETRVFGGDALNTVPCKDDVMETLAKPGPAQQVLEDPKGRRKGRTPFLRGNQLD